jgi:hypothetical protein
MSFGKESPCGGLLGSKSRAETRLSEVLGAAVELRDYRKLLLEIQKMSSKAREACPGLATAVTDRAFDAEAAGRVAIQHTLDSINELRDEGTFYDSLGNVAMELTAGGMKGYFEKLREPVVERFGVASASLFDEIASAAEELKFEFSAKSSSLIVHSENGLREENQLRLATTRQLGQTGRVSSAEFFGGRNGRTFFTAPSLHVPVDCHHRPIHTRNRATLAVDLYAATIGGLAVTKDLLYQHARRVAELGARGLRGEDPVTAVAVGLVIVGAVAVGVGIATEEPGVIAFGTFLIAAGACLYFVPGCTVIIGVSA